MKISNLAASSVALASFGLMLSGNVQADVYAYASHTLSNFTVTTSPGVLPDRSTFNLDGLATLGGTTINTGGPINSGSAPFDIPQAYQGAAADNPGENVFAQNPNNIPSANYSRADAQITTSELDPGNPPTGTGQPTQILSVAESYLSTPDIGRGDAQNSSDTTLTFAVGGGGTTTFSFSFDSDPELIACANEGGATCAVSDLGFPSEARAEISFTINITNSAGTTVFSWAAGSAPTVGDAGGSVNPFQLTNTIGRDETNIGLATYDPFTGAQPNTFSAASVALPDDVYTLIIANDVDINTELTAIPEAPLLGLIGIGFAGMGFRKHRKELLAA